MSDWDARDTLSPPVYVEHRLQAAVSDNKAAELVQLLAELMGRYAPLSSRERSAVVAWFAECYGEARKL